MRRGGIPKERIEPVKKQPALQINEIKNIEKRNSVQLVLQYFKRGKRDIREAYLIMKEEEEGEEPAIVQALE